MRSRMDRDLTGCRNALKVLGQSKEPEPAKIYNVFCKLTSEAVVLLLAVSGSENMNQYALIYFTQYRNSTVLGLTGDDLVEMGLKPGPVFQDVFIALRAARLDGRVNSREDEEAFVKKWFLPSKSNH